MSFSLFFENKGFILEHRGHTTIEEINDVNALIHGHKRFDSHKYQLINLLNADFSDVDQSKAVIPAATDWAASNTQVDIKVAMVAQSPQSIAFCQNYMAISQELGSPWLFKLFSELNDASEWAATSRNEG
jgi:hypothetical protein